MEDDSPRPQINASKLRVGGEIVGAIFAVGSMLIFMIGVPLLRYVFPVAILVGGLIALALRLSRHEKPGEPWLLAATENRPERTPRQPCGKDRESSARIVIVPVISHA
jgi:hypothetical protein